MIERKPNFEDDKIRAWAAGPKDRELEKSQEDPTVMSLDVEREEIFESRTYRFRSGPETLFYLMELVTSRHFELGLSPEEVMQAAAELMEDTTFKFLAKRSKEDGLICSLLVAVGSNDRSLLLRQERVGEDGYRQAVQEFEASFLSEGILTEPLVTTLEEWQRYSQEGSFSERSSSPL